MKKVLKFSATWCGPCKMLAKNLESVSTDIQIVDIDIDKNGPLAQQYGVRGVPTMVMLDEDEEVKRFVGVRSLKELENWLND